MKIKKTQIVFSWILIVLAIVCLLGSISVLFDLLKKPFDMDLISTFSMVTAWCVGFGALGIVMRCVNIKGFGWAIAAAAFLGVDAVAICNSVETQKYIQSPSTLVCLILTVIFIGIFIFVNIKRNKGEQE